MTSRAQAEALAGVLAKTADLVDAGELSEAAIRCCSELVLCGEARVALELASRAQAQIPGMPRESTVRLNLERARALFILYENAALLDLARATRELSESAGLVRERQMATVFESMALWRTNRVDESVATLMDLRGELLHAPEGLVHAMCAVSLSSAYITAGNWERARDFAFEGIVSARRIGDEHSEGLAWINLATAERGFCRWSSAEDAAKKALERFDRSSNSFQATHARRLLTIVQWKRGSIAPALENSHHCLTDAVRYGHAGQAAYARLVCGLVQLHAGNVTEAFSLFSAGEPSEILKESRPTLLRTEYLGDVFLEQGQAAKALEQYDTVLPQALALVPRGDIVAELRRRRAECYLLLGDPARAHAEALEAIAHTRELGDRYEEAATYRIAALAAAALGKPDEAKKHFTQGFAYYDDIETPYEWGKLWMSYGDWLCGEQAAHFRDLSGAHEAYRAAEQHFEQIGSAFKLGEARARLEKLAELMKAEGELLGGADLKARPRRRPRADRELQQRSQWAFETFGMVTRHRPLLDMLEQVSRVAASDLPVLVLGESGTGKELVARGVHFISGRTGRFVEVNCSAVPSSIMESEFFGSSHGSYTGSTRDRPGLLEDAHQGSFFLDEIGEMSLDLQSKLLRFLETGRVRRIGETDGRQVDVRLIAATNRAHDKLKSGSGFREDLYYRLAHAVVELPPLRERGDDGELLLDHFLEKFCDEARKPVALSPAARDKLLVCTWPGNVRQLRALIHRFVLQSPAGHVISPREIPTEDAAAAPRNFLEEMEGQEKRRIQEALEKAHFVKADAARFLRMSRTTLIGKMKRYGITA